MPEHKHAMWLTAGAAREGTMTAEQALKIGSFYVNGQNSADAEQDPCRSTTIRVEREGVLRYYLKLRAKTPIAELSHVGIFETHFVDVPR